MELHSHSSSCQPVSPVLSSESIAQEEQTSAGAAQWFRPIIARTTTTCRPTGPVAYDCVKLIVVRAGSAMLYGPLVGETIIHVGHAVLIPPGIPVASSPEELNTVTSVYLDTDYVMDHLYWQYVGLLQERIDARVLAESIYDRSIQILALGEERAAMMAPWLDELVALSADGAPRQRFHRMQSLWSAIADQIAPHVHMTPIGFSAGQRATVSPREPRYRRFSPLREEALAIQHLISGDVSHQWTLKDLAIRVHLSQRQVSRLYSEAFGKTPLAHLRMLRVQEMARLLQQTNMSVSKAAREVGWRSRDHASQVFREAIGISPNQYRIRYRTDPDNPMIRTSSPAR